MQMVSLWATIHLAEEDGGEEVIIQVNRSSIVHPMEYVRGFACSNHVGAIFLKAKPTKNHMIASIL